MNRNFTTLRDIILKLSDNSLLKNDVLLTKYQKLMISYPPMIRPQVEYLLSDKTDNPKSDFLELAARKEAFFYLPPFNKDIGYVPVLILRCDYSKSPPEACLALLMFRYCESEEKIKCFGFRFEAPHKAQTPEKDTIHDYWHVQISAKIRGRVEKRTRDGRVISIPVGLELPECPSWIPDAFPGVPTSAKCPVSLILCLLVSLYGKEMFNRFLVDCNIDSECIEPLKHIFERKYRSALGVRAEEPVKKRQT